MVFVEFQIGTPVDRATTDVRDAVARIRGELPQGILEPNVGREEIDGGPIAYYAVSTTGMTEEQLSWFVDDTINKRLLAVPGVAQVNRSGGVDREIRVDLDPARMQSIGITAAEVNDQLRQVNLDAAGGRAQVGGSEQSIRVLGGAHTAQQLANTRLMVGPGAMAAWHGSVTSPRCAMALPRCARSRGSTGGRPPPSGWRKPRGPPTSIRCVA